MYAVNNITTYRPPVNTSPKYQTRVQSVHTREWKLAPLIAVVATTAHPVAVARVLLRQQQAQRISGRR